jgi:hypothetical protein
MKVEPIIGIWRTLRVIAKGASSWAFVAGLLIPFVIIAFHQAIDVNFTNWLLDYSAFALLAALVTVIAYWFSRAHASRAKAMGPQKPLLRSSRYMHKS